MKKNYSLSVIIITLNEEDRLPECLESVLSIADEIIVVDSGSTDRTVEIAESFGAKVFQTDWPGYGVQKQRALDQANSEWVLSIDADEALSPELRKDIAETLSNQPLENAFEFPRTVHLWGTTLKYGNMSRDVLRLFRRQDGYFTDSRVHEKIVVSKGKTGRLNANMEHYSIRDFEHYLQKNVEYAWLGSRKKFEAGKNCSLLAATLNAIWVFLQNYIVKRGILDGKLGFLAACMYSQYAFNKYAGCWSLQLEKKVHDRSQV